MAHIGCKYHNERPAKWYCEPCQIYFCTSCLPNKNSFETVKCPVCHLAVSSVAAENSIDSFWNRLPKFFMYPISVSSLLFLLILSITSIGIEYDPILAISIPIIVTIFFLRYSYIILEQTAKGHMQVPQFSIDVLFDKLDLPLKQILILVAAFAVNFTVYDMFGFVTLVFTLTFSILASPASIMVLATEHSFFRAFNPLIIARFITLIGKPYFVLCIFLTMLLISSEASFSILSNIIPTKYIWPGFFFINMYFILIMYNMMGYVIFQYHEKLEFDIEINLDSLYPAESSEELTKHEAIIQAEILLKEGKIDLAIKKLSNAINISPVDFSLREMFHKLLKVTAKHQILSEHSTSYIERLLASNNQAKAIEILIETRELIANYLPQKANIRYEMALYLNVQNYPEIALACVNNLHRDFPSYDGIPKAYFLAAKIMCEKMGDDNKAITVLEYVLNNYELTALAPEIYAYIEMVKGLNSNVIDV